MTLKEQNKILDDKIESNVNQYKVDRLNDNKKVSKDIVNYDNKKVSKEIVNDDAKKKSNQKSIENITERIKKWKLLKICLINNLEMLKRF